MLPMPRKDRAAHFVYGAALANAGVALFLLGNIVLGRPSPDPLMGALCGFAVAAAAGAIKEFSDRYLNKKEVDAGLAPSHGVSSADFAWTVLGGACACVPTLLLA